MKELEQIITTIEQSKILVLHFQKFGTVKKRWWELDEYDLFLLSPIVATAWLYLIIFEVISYA